MNSLSEQQLMETRQHSEEGGVGGAGRLEPGEMHLGEEETEGERRLFIGGAQHDWPFVMLLRYLGAIS